MQSTEATTDTDFLRFSEMRALRPRHRRVRLGLFVFIGLYVALYLRVFLGSSMGRFPVLDGAENIQLAARIAQGALPAEPFYRAMLYPGLLSLFLRTGVSVDWLPVAAGLLGAICHLGATFCVYRLARRAWGSGKAGFVAAALYGFNPVVVYFSAEPLDTTLALFLFLAGLDVFHSLYAYPLKNESSARVFRRMAAGGALWALAMLARPHYAIVLAALPLLSAVLWRRKRLLLARALVAFVLAAGLCLGAAGLLQKQVCGQFRIMPAQGAYNLWAGNRPGATGRYFEQKIHLESGSVPDGENPARVESGVPLPR